MNLLLDTHVVLWWLADAPELGAGARDAIADRANIVHVSAATAWEIVVKRALGKLEIPDRWEQALAEEPFSQLAVSWRHALQVGKLPDVHRDPFDRLLVAQAIVEGLTLVTRDEVLNRYGIATLKA
ncbi:MAG: type II toxin-antitoxin system VapC family toxin [Lentisphaerae bacterium]|nr:type II toxin-antitoxin system VapC family toxin [Lentisphaerota bacterium]